MGSLDTTRVRGLRELRTSADETAFPVPLANAADAGARLRRVQHKTPPDLRIGSSLSSEPAAAEVLS